MALLNQYVLIPNQLSAFFERLREGQAPEKFTRQHLKDIGFLSSNHRALIPLLKGLGFLTGDGTPTARYKEFLDATKSKHVLGEAINENYGDIFQIKASPNKDDKAAIAGKFKSTYNVSENTANNLAATFLALYELSDKNVASGKASTSKLVETTSHTEEKDEEKPPTQIDVSGPKVSKAIELCYNFQIHLPPTKDIEVYNAIFKSMREHLLSND